ncbi:DUF2256 domain-containing protein [Methylomonas koyamae]|uniref:DUF2256 domain-containing protein n=1 Tax=Methylomonas koyamae TaxID=702114 RepID=UPI003571542F
MSRNTARASGPCPAAQPNPSPALGYKPSWSFDAPQAVVAIENLPVCSRPFAWRKKWAKDWDAVKYCSTRCRNQRSSAAET